MCLIDPTVCDRHWIDIKETLQLEIDIKDPNLTIEKLIQMDVQKHREEITEI